MNYGKILNRLISHSGTTAQELSRAADVSHTSVGRAIGSAHQMMRPDTLAAVLGVLGETPASYAAKTMINWTGTFEDEARLQIIDAVMRISSRDDLIAIMALATSKAGTIDAPAPGAAARVVIVKD